MARFYVDRYTAKIEQTDRYLVRLVKKDGTVTENLEPRQLFPLSNTEMYITLLDENECEVALVRDLAELDAESAKALRECFSEHYRIPQITAVLSTEEKFGKLTFEVMTNYGKTSFTIRSRHTDIKSTKEGRILMRDTDDNRYEVDDWHKMDAHSRHLLFSYL